MLDGVEQYHKEKFESIKSLDTTGEELWSAREIMPLLGYQTWDSFLNGPIKRGMSACDKSGYEIGKHFRQLTKMVEIGNNTVRPTLDYRLTRYACYLVAQNGDPKIPQISLAQTYFAIQTRHQELDVEQMQELERIQARKKLTHTQKEFASTLFKHDVDGSGVASIVSQGDQVLFGNHSTDAMKKKLGIPDKRPLADFLPTVTIKAKDLAAEITTFNTKKNNLKGKLPISSEHKQNNQQVRNVLLKRDIYPEKLPAEEDIKKLEKRVKKNRSINDKTS